MSKNNQFKYEYSLTPIRYVKENPEEYIIPDCLDACKILWEKGIDTTQCSNYQDHNSRYIEINITTLSEENYNFFKEKVNNHEEGFYIEPTQHYPRISVNCEGEEARTRLCELASMFFLQDTNEYMTAEDYLDSYRRTNGQYILLETGESQRDINPEYANATLADALDARDDWELYIEEEGKIYYNQEALKKHHEYLERRKQEFTK